MPRTTVVIPTYNEAQNIAPIIMAIQRYAPQVYILVVDDNSPDGTADLVRDIAAKDPHVSLLFRQKKAGIGKAYLNAFEEVLKDDAVEWICMFDADFSHDPKYLPALFEASKHADVVVGSRYVIGGGTTGWALHRRILSRFANAYCRIITGMPVNDTTAGLNLMRASMMRKANLSTIHASGHAFIMELKYRLWKVGARFAEVPVMLEDRRAGKSKMSNKIIQESSLAPWKMRFSRTL